MPLPPPTQYPVDSVISAFQQMHHNYDLSAISGGNTFTLQLSFAPGVQTTFDGVSAFTVTETRTLSKNVVSQGTNAVTEYVTIRPYTELGGINTTNGEVMIDANQMPLPDLVTVGQSGSFDTYTTYTDSTRTTVYETGTVTWSLEADTSANALACLNYVGTIDSGPDSGPFSESDCCQIDESGNVLSVHITITEGGGTLVFK